MESKSSQSNIIYIVLLFTLVYLLFELSFSARLLDVAGGISTQADIDGIEKYGRRLSGIALGLFFLRRVIDTEFGLKQKIVILAIVFSVSYFAMYQTQEWVVRHLTDRLSDEERKEAVVLAIAAPQIASGDVDIANQQYGDGGMDSASAKSFVALFPALALYKDNLNQDIEKLTPLFVKSELTRSCESGTNGCLGDPQTFHNEVWKKIVDESQKKFKSMAESYNHATSSSAIKNQQTKAWKRHVAAIRSKTGYDPENVPESMYEPIRQKLKKDHGLILPYGWNPSDKSAFNDAVANQIYNQANKSIKATSFESFFEQKATQEKIRETLNVTNKSMAFPLVYTEEESEKHIYTPVLEHLIGKELKRLNSDAKEFASGGKYEEMGDSAAKRVFVPAVALFFSLLGGFGHIIKSGALIFEIRGRKFMSGVKVMAIAVVLASMVMFAFSNPVIASKPYKILADGIKEKNGTAWALGAEWIIRTESLLYPFNNWLRINVLQGVNFEGTQKEQVSNNS